MPSVPHAATHQSVTRTKSSKSASNMIGGTSNSVIESCPTSSPPLSVSASSSTPNLTTGADLASDKSDQPIKNQRNRSHAKIKLLVRSHAMRESTSPPREPNGVQNQEMDKISVSSSPANSVRPKQLNNNELMQDSNISNITVDSAKKTVESPVSQTSANSLPNGQIGSPEVIPPKQISPLVDEIKTSSRSPIENANCSSCGLNTSSASLQTPAQQIFATPKASHGLQHSPRSTNIAQQIKNNEKNRSAGGDNQKINNNSSSSSSGSTGSSFVCNVPCSNQCGNSNNNNNNNNNTLSVSRPGSRHKLRHRNVSQGSFDGNSPSISRDSSTELYTDSTGIDLEQFIADTLNRNQKDRTVLLRIERELVDFARDRQRVCHKFPNMSSYNRMLVHRVAAYFGMEHNVDQSGLCVVVTRTKNTRIPDARFKESIRDDIVLTEEPKRSILKRDSNSFEDSFNFKSPDRFIADYCRRSKSFEEREEEYERARRRIFKDSSGESAEAASWPWSSAESSDTPPKPRMQHTLIADHGNRQPMLLKVESFHEGGSLRRPSVPKSYSFGGYAAGGMLTRDNSVTSTCSAGARLTKQDSATSTCSRLSPSSSGYKSQSQRSDATISPSPSPSPVMPTGRNNSRISIQEAASSSPEVNGVQRTVIWAVTNISSVPAGSVLINPRTNSPYKNSDGSIYHFDPDNPPKSPREDDNEDRRDKRVAGLSNSKPDIPRANLNNSQTKSDLNKRRSRYEKNSQEIVTNFANSSNSASLPFDNQNNQNQQQRSGGQQQTLVKNCPPQHVYNHTQQAVNQTPYASYVSPNTQTNNQGVYFMHARPSSAIAIAPFPSSTQIRVEGNPQSGERGEMLCCTQNPMIAGYQMPAVQAQPVQTFEEVTDLSGAFVGMNLYDQRAAGDAQSVALATQPYQNSQQSVNHAIHRVQPGSNPCWQSHPSQIPLHQTMYFVPPSPAAIQNGTNSVDGRQHLQRFAPAYSFGHPGSVTPTNQTASTYVGGYPTPAMPGLPGMQSPQNEFAYQPATHVIPAYYNPGQSNMQAAPVIYGVPTPPNTPTNNQMSGVPPLVYVNSNGYGPSTLITSGTFGHPVQAGATQPTPSYVVPNVVLRQAVPAITGIQTPTPPSLRRASRSPDPGHEIFGSGGRDRNQQPQYQIPMCQGVHIVQGVAGNPRLQYAPVPSPLSSVSQGCPRPYRPPSYTMSSNAEGSRNNIDNRNQKLRKHR